MTEATHAVKIEPMETRTTREAARAPRRFVI
jgi:hypothetical protein